MSALMRSSAPDAAGAYASTIDGESRRREPPAPGALRLGARATRHIGSLAIAFVRT